MSRTEARSWKSCSGGTEADIFLPAGPQALISHRKLLSEKGKEFPSLIRPLRRFMHSSEYPGNSEVSPMFKNSQAQGRKPLVWR